ncbi:MAG: HEAT repeat domain-containing protein [Candidatus Omnitrophica bacterium]|nr:HEAT repeat domain-containing protein [Candidatus Omnitrophota bacterium]
MPAAMAVPQINFKLPDSVAVIEDGWTAPATAKNNGRTIILIQDAHTNDSAQMNLAHALHTILPAEKIRYVFTEAAQGDVTLSYLKPLFPRPALEEAARRFVRKGLLKGSEYLSVSSDSDFVIWGVEDKALYEQSVLAYKNEAENRQKALTFISRAQRSMEDLKPENASEAYLKLDRLKSDYTDGKISIIAYLDGLKKSWQTATQLNGQTLISFKTLDRLSALRSRESKLDVARIAEEQRQALKALSAAARSELSAENTPSASPFAFKSGSSAQASRGFYALLEAKLLSNHASRKTYPNLHRYFAYLNAAKKFDAMKALDELAAFESAVFDRATVTREDRWFMVLTDNLKSWKAMLELKITPREYTHYMAQKDLFDIDLICGFVNGLIAKTRRHMDRVLVSAGETERAREAAEHFYALTARRDEAFMKNIAATMDAKNLNKAVLITGGFHADNLKNLLKREGYSYVSIIPQVTHETDHARYERLLLNQVDVIPNDRNTKTDVQGTVSSDPAANTNMTLYAAQMPGTVEALVESAARLAEQELSEVGGLSQSNQRGVVSQRVLGNQNDKNLHIASGEAQLQDPLGARFADGSKASGARLSTASKHKGWWATTGLVAIALALFGWHRQSSNVPSISSKQQPTSSAPADAPIVEVEDSAKTEAPRRSGLAARLDARREYRQMNINVAQDEGDIQYLIEALKSNSADRHIAAYALGVLNDIEAIPALIESLKDGNWLVRARAVEALGAFRDPGLVPVLIEVLKNDSEFKVREIAAKALGVIRDAGAIPALIEALGDKSIVKGGNVHGFARHSLSKIDNPIKIDLLMQATKSTNGAVRDNAIIALGESKDPKAIPTIVDYLMKPSAGQTMTTGHTYPFDDDIRRGSAARALAEIMGPQSVPIVIDAIKELRRLSRFRRAFADDDHEEYLFRPLRQFKDPALMRLWIEDLKNPHNPYIRNAAANELGLLGDSAALPALTDALKNELDSGRQHEYPNTFKTIQEAIKIIKDNAQATTKSGAPKGARMAMDETIKPFIPLLVHKDAVNDEDLLKKNIQIMMIAGNSTTATFKKVVYLYAKALDRGGDERPKILISGGIGRLTDLLRVEAKKLFGEAFSIEQGLSEAEIIKRIMIGMAQDAELTPDLPNRDKVLQYFEAEDDTTSFILEKQSRFTLENFTLTKPILESRHLLNSNEPLRIMYIQTPWQQLRTVGTFNKVFETEIKSGRIQGTSYTIDVTDGDVLTLDELEVKKTIVMELFRIAANVVKGDVIFDEGLNHIAPQYWQDAQKLFASLDTADQRELAALMFGMITSTTFNMTPETLKAGLSGASLDFVTAVLNAAARLSSRIQRVIWSAGPGTTEGLTEAEREEYESVAWPAAQKAARDGKEDAELSMLFASEETESGQASASAAPRKPEKLFTARVGVDGEGRLVLAQPSQETVVLSKQSRTSNRTDQIDLSVKASETRVDEKNDFYATVSEDRRLTKVPLDILRDAAEVSKALGQDNESFREYAKDVLSSFVLIRSQVKDARLFLPIEGVLPAHQRILRDLIEEYGLGGAAPAVLLESTNSEDALRTKRILMSVYDTEEHFKNGHLNFRHQPPTGRTIYSEPLLTSVSSALDFIAGKSGAMDALEKGEVENMILIVTSSGLSGLDSGNGLASDRVERILKRMSNPDSLRGSNFLESKILGQAIFEANQTLLSLPFRIEHAIQIYRILRAAVESAA